MKPKKVFRISTLQAAAPLVAALILSFAASLRAQSTIFSSTSVPAELSASDRSPIEVGVKFQSSVNGYIKGIRFYKGPANTGTHIGHLWTSKGTLLGTVTFANETATGWQEADFAAPIAIMANTTYVASYHTNTGGYGLSVDYFSNRPASNPPLLAPSAPAAEGNGVFIYGVDAFPNDTSSSNYWVGVDFTQNATLAAGTTIFNGTSAPAKLPASYNNAIELGVKFQARVNGYIKGILFYKGPANTGTHIGHLWTSKGTLLGTVIFKNETATGWQEANFAAPIAIMANTTYVASYHTNTGGYGRSVGYFSYGPASNPPLLAPSAPAAGGNGVFIYGTDSFPNQTFSGSNYWVDVDFTTTYVKSTLAIGTTPEPAGIVGKNYLSDLPVTGGIGPYTWRVTSGQLPPGLSLNSDGILWGAPTAYGTYNFTAEVTDSTGRSASGPLTVSVVSPLSITSTSLPGATGGAPYDASLSVSGGVAPYTYSLTSGQLPPGLMLSSSGVISGTPTIAGSYSFVLQAGDAAGEAASQSFTLGVAPATSLSGNGSGPTPLDSFGGIASVNCTNPNGGKYFGLAMVGSHKVLCDPEGHPFFGRGVYVFDVSSLGNDEAGGNYDSYVTAKFGSTNTSYIWSTEELTRLKSWGFNMVGPQSSGYALPMWPWYNGGTNPVKTPFLYMISGCLDSWKNSGGFGPAPVKDVLDGLSPFLNIYRGYDGITDYEDPAWATYINGVTGSNGTYTDSVVARASASDKSYIVGIQYCDSDYAHGFGAGPEFDTTPVEESDPRLSYIVASGSPVEWASSRQGQIYTDPTVYSKEIWHDQLTAKYGSIGALNSSWGSNYTTFGTSGVCYGSHFASWLCPSPSPAAALGVGNGSTLSFSAALNPQVSRKSVGIFVNGVLAGGDAYQWSGSTQEYAIYGPNLSGTVDYATGALSATFAGGSAPPAGAAITVEYIANGWGVGSGVMDEDGRPSHQGWTGHNPVCIDGVGAASNCISQGGGPPYASPGMVSDLNALDIALATRFASVTSNAIQSNFPGAIDAGLELMSGKMVPPNRYVLQAFAPYVKLMMFGGQGVLTQPELDFIHQYAGDMALGLTTYQTANFDSPFGWPNSSCSASGATVTCTVTTPNDFAETVRAGYRFMTSCADPTYDVAYSALSVLSGDEVSYTANQLPLSATTTCNVAYSNLNQGGYPTQAERAQAVAQEITALPNWSYTADGVHPYVLSMWWQWSDKEDERQNWGLVDTRDNAYNGKETTTATAPCQPPLQAYLCGGELRSGWGSDDGITPLTNASKALDSTLAGYSSTP